MKPTLEKNRDKLLVHLCCGPCGAGVIEELLEEYDVVGFFYNPNIYPEQEYEKRLQAARELMAALGGILREGERDFGRWAERISGLEGEPEGGARCAICYRVRMERAAEEARRLGIGLFTTTLTVSPHKNAQVVNDVGTAVADSAGVGFLARDFKKGDGFGRSCRRSKTLGLYRQRYCGCKYSLRDAKMLDNRTGSG